MNRYAVAYVSLFHSDLKIAIVEANNPAKAIIEGVCQLTDDELGSWVSALACKSIEEIKQDFFDTDQLVTVNLIPRSNYGNFSGDRK